MTDFQETVNTESSTSHKVFISKLAHCCCNLVDENLAGLFAQFPKIFRKHGDNRIGESKTLFQETEKDIVDMILLVIKCTLMPFMFASPFYL